VSCASTSNAPKRPYESERERLAVSRSTLAKPTAKQQENAVSDAEKKPSASGTLTEIPSLDGHEMAKGTSKKEALPFSDTRKVQVAFESMPISEFVNHVFGDVFGVNYVAGEQVNNNKKPIIVAAASMAILILLKSFLGLGIEQISNLEINSSVLNNLVR
jgi:hypothetical protein